MFNIGIADKGSFTQTLKFIIQAQWNSRLCTVLVRALEGSSEKVKKLKIVKIKN
jgi:hypothetical protein